MQLSSSSSQQLKSTPGNLNATTRSRYFVIHKKFCAAAGDLLSAPKLPQWLLLLTLALWVHTPTSTTPRTAGELCVLCPRVPHH